jgi:hypothetical protein
MNSTAMANRSTRVPSTAPPTLPDWARFVVPVADGFMLLMISRPATGSLRRIWVTPATFWLSLCAFVGAVPLGSLLLYVGFTQQSTIAALLGFAGLLGATGCGAVAVVGWL